jgi:hypothetical protein
MKTSFNIDGPARFETSRSLFLYRVNLGLGTEVGLAVSVVATTYQQLRN